MPSFCRHNRFLQNCPICREPEAPAAPAPRRRGGGSTVARAGRGGAPAGLLVRRAERAADDGYRCPVVPGLKSSVDAERLASELAWAAGRLAELATRPPGLYADVIAAEDPEEAAWLAFQIAYIAPLEGEDPFAAIRAVRTTWRSGDLPDLDGVALGSRTAHDSERGDETLQAYRAWATRSGSQLAALTGDESWSPQRRFDRIFERMALPGLTRGSRFDFLASLGRLGVADLRAGALYLRGTCPTTVAAKRIFGIGDTILLDRRAAALADACEVELEALDLALHNWEREEQRTTMGARDDAVRLAPSTAIASGLGL